jgi:membrane protein insertase Oxa1/YidC/SpoIIIJ
LLKNKLITVISVALLLIVLFIIFDGLKTSSELSPEKFVEVYVQLSVASEMYDTDLAKLEQERKKILKKHGVTQEEIDHFIKEYNRNPEKWAKVWERIVRRLEKEIGNPVEGGEEKINPP